MPENLLDDLMDTDACTLPTAERPLRLAEFRSLFEEHLTGVSWMAGRLRLSLSGPAGLRERCADLTARESECCSFFDFSLTGPDNALELEVSAPTERRDILAGLAALADGVRR